MSLTHLVLILSLTSLCAGQNNEVNVAINKTCNQSTTFDVSWSAEKAVDDKLAEEGFTNCMHTARYDYDPWWAVDLGRIYPVLNVKLYTRGTMFRRVVNSTIMVDEQFCTKIYPLPNNNPLVLRCKYLIYGKRINITRDYNNQGEDYYLNFCEFQVWVPNDVIGCDIGKFGPSCQDTCPTACGEGPGKNACHKDGGKCYGCIDGKAGDACSEACTSSHCLNNKCYQDNGTCIDCTDYFLNPDCTECKPRFYGDNCNISCKSGNCLNNTCDRNSGECLQCQGNFKPPSCMECIDGYMGIRCDKKCDARCYLKCNQTSGYCFQCYPGWQGNDCGKECNTSFYGADCNERCGQCMTPSTCNHTNGHCVSCNSGYIPPLCQEECVDGTYGIDCKNACGQCANGAACDKRLGTCHKCVPGKMPPNCIQDCENGTYGEDCNQTCGHCGNNTSCSVSNGHCISCQRGFQLPLCINALKSDEGSDNNNNNNNLGYIIGPVIAVLVVLIIVIVVIFVIRKRRRMPKDVYSNMPDETNMDVGRQSNDNTRGNNEATRGSKPKAAVKPQAHGKPDNQTSSGVIYENVTKTHNEPPNTKPKPNQRELNATSLTSKSSPKVSKGKLFKPNEKERNLLKADDNDETPVDEQSLGFDNDNYTVDVADTVYSNDVPLSNFDPVGIPVDLLQNYILDKLKSGTMETEFSTLSPKMEYAHECGLKQENHYKNRFNSILPYDSTRVVLNKLKDDDSSDYINANYIRGHGQTTYIAAQGPKNNTVQDFWRMVWQEHVKHIVMLTNVQENAKAKCYEYWPQKGAKMTYGQIEVKGLEESRRAHYVIRAFSVKNVAEEEKRRVEHLQYVNWFDHDVPQATPLVDFWRYAKTRASQRSTAPLLVHCSAGVGRTGTYLALDILLDQTEHEKEVNIYGVVRRMREDRCNMVQNKKQYEFLHEVILEAYASRNTRYDVTNFEKVFPHPISTDSANTRIDQEFKTLQFMRDSLSRPSHSNALLEENRSKNRNSTALPDDKHLVYLSPFVKGRNQYINAVYLSTFLDARGSILTQLPFPETLVDIWRLIDGCGIETIISISDVNDKEKDSCRYWPQSEGEVIKTGIYTVTLKSKVNLGTSLISYGLDLQNQEKSESREVRVLHYMDWEREIPTNIPELFEMIELLRSNSDVTDGKCIPVLVQCIDGASKSGLFCALWEIISRIICDNEIDVYIAVRNVQIVRPEAVTSHAHYRYCYQVAQQYRTSTNVYANT